MSSSLYNLGQLREWLTPENTIYLYYNSHSYTGQTFFPLLSRATLLNSISLPGGPHDQDPRIGSRTELYSYTNTGFKFTAEFG